MPCVWFEVRKTPNFPRTSCGGKIFRFDESHKIKINVTVNRLVLHRVKLLDDATEPPVLSLTFWFRCLGIMLVCRRTRCQIGLVIELAAGRFYVADSAILKRHAILSTCCLITMISPEIWVRSPQWNMTDSKLS